MFKAEFSKRRFTLATLLFVAANQLGCQEAPVPATGTQSVLAVQLTGAGYGAVSSEPAGISCGATCSAAFVSGTSVTLTAQATAKGTFVKWGGSCQGSAATCTVSVAAATLVTAQFVPPGTPLATLTVQKSGLGTGTVASQPDGISCGAQCQSQFVVGDMVTLTAVADAGNAFVGWSGACTGALPSCKVTVAAALQVSARFNGPPPAVTAIAPFYADKAGGTVVTITGSGFQATSQVTIGGTAATGVTYVSATQLQVTVPAGAQAGCAAIVISNPDTQQVTAASAMAYKPTAVSYAAALAPAAVADSPSVVRSGDFNHDGKLDLVIAGQTGKVQYLAGQGDGTFAAAADVFGDANFSGLEVADFNQDGKLDVLALSRDSAKVFVLIGNGDGTFTKKNEYTTGAGPAGLSLRDVNADGYPDVVTANSDDTDVSVLLGNGDGSFKGKVDYPVGAAVQAVRLGDVNQDTYPDIVTAATDGSVYFLLGQGDGTFQAASGISVTGSLQDLALGDLDGDGYLDFSTTDSAGTDVMTRLGDGVGGFATSLTNFTLGTEGAAMTKPYAVGFWDVDLDGKLDVVTTSQESGVSYFLNQGSKRFGTRVDLAVGVKPQSVIFQDLNGDCLPDFATANQGSASVSVILNTSQ